MIETIEVTAAEVAKVLSLEESHFADLKSIDIAPAKLTRSVSALSNAEGGELFIGVDEDRVSKNRSWRGFANQEAANGHVQALEAVFPLGHGYTYTFLRRPVQNDLVLKIEVEKSREIRPASNGTVYIRRGAQNLPVTTDEELSLLRRNKGLTSFETETIAADQVVITDSLQVTEFMLEDVPSSEAQPGSENRCFFAMTSRLLRELFCSPTSRRLCFPSNLESSSIVTIQKRPKEHEKR